MRLLLYLSRALLCLLRPLLYAFCAFVRGLFAPVFHCPAGLLRRFFRIVPCAFGILLRFRATVLGGGIVLRCHSQHLVRSQRKHSRKCKKKRETFHLLPPYRSPTRNKPEAARGRYHKPVSSRPQIPESRTFACKILRALGRIMGRFARINA